MKRTLQVFIGDEARLVGTLHYDRNGAREHAAFVYADAFEHSERKAAQKNS